ncbi:MAG TPA: sigma-70 family RNA polymerase sigma factor [Thermoanaerobaculia bacterium]|nr:sigma-70 family RNA polymerase sigma factor [Thermoanaerobaculia bacterium]
MDDPPPGDVTELLLRWRGGDDAARDELMKLVHHDLRRLARQHLRRERPGHTLDTGALVNELYLRLVRSSQVQWSDRLHFYAVVADLMKRVLIDWARARRSRKRGGGLVRVPLDEADAVSSRSSVDLLAVDEAVRQLAAVSPRQARLIELRFWGGFSIEQAADVLGVSTDTVKRDWRSARLWLKRALRSAGDGPPAVAPH